MKKSLIALAALAATSAFAQSSVTINGSIAYGANRNAAGVTSYSALKGDRNFLGFSGVEDLGGGNSATFLMQQRFRTESGLAGTYMNTTGSANNVTERNLMEQAAIGLNSKDFGSARVGRFTNILGLNLYNLMEDSPHGAGTSAQYGRLSGQFQYTSPKVSGFDYIYLNANKALNTTATVAGNGFGTGDLTNATRNLVAHTVRFNQGAIYAQVSMVTGLTGEKSIHMGGTYDLGGGLKLAAGQFRQKDALSTGDSNGQLAHNNTAVGVEYKTGPWVTALMVSQADDKVEAAHTGKKKQIGAKAYYFLSKRTSIDFEVSDTKNTTAAAKGTAYFAGVRHTF